MKSENMALILGGILPALLFGLAGVFQKASNQIGTGIYLFMIGIGVCLVGATLFIIKPDHTFSINSGIFALLIGISWAAGMGLVAITLHTYATPLARLVPIYNMNTLVAVLLALVIFAEWRDVSGLKLMSGAILITIGGTLVANS